MLTAQVLDDVSYAGLLIRNWLHIDTPLPETIKLIGNIEKKTANITEKAAVYHIVNGDPAVFHTSKTALWQGALRNITFVSFLLFSICESPQDRR